MERDHVDALPAIKSKKEVTEYMRNLMLLLLFGTSLVSLRLLLRIYLGNSIHFIKHSLY